MASNDSVVISGSEDGRIFAWDVLEGKVFHKLQQDDQAKDQQPGKKSVISAVCECPVRKEWASAGGDGMLIRMSSLFMTLTNEIGSVIVWGLG